MHGCARRRTLPTALDTANAFLATAAHATAALATAAHATAALAAALAATSVAAAASFVNPAALPTAAHAAS